MHTYLITGGAGFIGTNLTYRLVKEGNTVTVVDDLSGGNKERLPKEARFIKLDICDNEGLTRAMEGVEKVVHLAALPRVQFSIEHPFDANRVNVEGTLSVLEAARKAGVGRVVFAASSSAYGDQETLPLHEGLPPLPKSPYALHKYMGEEMMKLWHSLHGIETVSLRFFNVYGPYFDPNGPYALVIGKFLAQQKAGLPLTITGDGTQTRDFTYVSDTVDAVIKASESDRVGKGEVFNVGAGRNVSINDVARLIGGPIEYIKARHEPHDTQADISRIKDVLGWSPRVTLEEGIAILKNDLS